MSAKNPFVSNEHSTTALRASVAVAFFSALIFLEGIARAAAFSNFMANTAESLVFSSTRALLAAALCEVFMGIAGMLLAGGVSAGVNVAAFFITFLMAVITLSGWFIWLLFIFIQPGVDASAVRLAPEPWTYLYEYQAFVAFGILTAAFYCISLLAGQWVFGVVLMRLRAGVNIATPGFYRAFGMFSSIVVFFTGLWILAAGGMATKVDPGPHSLFQPPIFIVFSGWPIATGVIEIFVGLVGVLTFIMTPNANLNFFLGVLHMINLLWQTAVMVLYQPPALGFPQASVPIAGLVISQVLPAWLAVLRREAPHGDTESVSLSAAKE